jgi:hypothetical protein
MAGIANSDAASAASVVNRTFFSRIARTTTPT